jgi:hypothetical protein
MTFEERLVSLKIYNKINYWVRKTTV